MYNFNAGGNSGDKSQLMSASVISKNSTNTLPTLLSIPTASNQSQQQSTTTLVISTPLALTTKIESPQHQLSNLQQNQLLLNSLAGVQSTSQPSSSSSIINLGSSSNSPKNLKTESPLSPLSPSDPLGSPIARNIDCSPTSHRCSSSGGENRRVGHIHAEQKRRYNIKNGFDTLHSLIPQLSQNPNSKVSVIKCKILM